MSALRPRWQAAATYEQQRKEVSAIASKFFGAHGEAGECHRRNASAGDHGSANRCSRVQGNTTGSEASGSAGYHCQLSRLRRGPAVKSGSSIGLDLVSKKAQVAWCELYPEASSVGRRGRTARQGNGASARRLRQGLENQLLLLLSVGRNPENGFPPFAFRLHQFISKGDTVYATPKEETSRYVDGPRAAICPRRPQPHSAAAGVLPRVRPGILLRSRLNASSPETGAFRATRSTGSGRNRRGYSGLSVRQCDRIPGRRL